MVEHQSQAVPCIEVTKSTDRYAVPRGVNSKISKNCNVIAAAHPDPQSPNVTGRYEDTEAKFSLLINQAGSHLECWLTPILTYRDRRSKTVVRLGGDLQGNGSFTIYNYPSTEPKGRLSVLDDGLELEVKARKWLSELMYQEVIHKRQFRLVRNRATFSHVIPAPADRNELPQRLEWAPLSEAQFEKIAAMAQEVSNLVTAVLAKLPRAGATLSDSFFDLRLKSVQEELAAIDKRIEECLGPESSLGDWHVDDIESARYVAQVFLQGEHQQHFGVVQSTLRWLQYFTTLRDEISWMRNTSVYLLSPVDEPTSASLHVYEFDLDVSGLSLDLIGGGAVYGGTLTIRKTEPTPWSEAKEYGIALLHFSLGIKINLALGDSFHTTGVASTMDEWRPDDFSDATIDLTGVDVSGALLWEGKGHSVVSVMEIRQKTDLRRSPLLVDFGGTYETESDGIKLGGEVGRYFGWLGENRELTKEEIRDKIFVQREYAFDAEPEDAVDFELGCALLTRSAKIKLRFFSAMELAALVAPNSTLVITGHTDRLGSDGFNRELSKKRALNTYMAMRDILGSRSPMLENCVCTDLTSESSDDISYDDPCTCYVRWAGEEQATSLIGDEDEVPNPSQRKVDIRLNSPIRITLQGA